MPTQCDLTPCHPLTVWLIKIITTTDLVELISETEFKWLGRFDSIINSGGIKLIPEQIEEKIGVIIEERIFVAGVPDEQLGEKLILIIETKKGLSKDFILRKLKNLKSLTKYEIPKEVHFIKDFAETDTNKINRISNINLLDL